MKRKWKTFMIAVLIQILIVAAVPARQIYTRMTGTPILLRTAPVDPYNFLSGYYVTLGYDISTPNDIETLGNEYTRRYRLPVYVILKPGDNGCWDIESLHKTKPAFIPPGDILIKGHCRYHRIEYGIEHFYIPETSRRDIESMLRRERNPDHRERATVEVKVDQFGHAAITKLIIGHKEYEY